MEVGILLMIKKKSSRRGRDEMTLIVNCGYEMVSSSAYQFPSFSVEDVVPHITAQVARFVLNDLEGCGLTI